jgi:hypothetical protein
MSVRWFAAKAPQKMEIASGGRIKMAGIYRIVIGPGNISSKTAAHLRLHFFLVRLREVCIDGQRRSSLQMRVRREHIRQVHELRQDFGQLVLLTIEGDGIRWHAGERKEENEIDPKRQLLLWRLKIEMSLCCR